MQKLFESAKRKNALSPYFLIIFNVFYSISPLNKPNAFPTSFFYTVKFLLEEKENIA